MKQEKNEKFLTDLEENKKARLLKNELFKDKKKIRKMIVFSEIFKNPFFDIKD